MRPLTVALLQNDATTVRTLCSSLCHHFHSIHAASTISELRHIIAKQRAEVVIVDLERACLSEIELLRREFSSICIVCTHRVADDEMWTAALNAGAADMCSSLDTRSIVMAALRNTAEFPQVAAA
jgi:DNA-binding NarL/FixJ family response regulator